jgi:hypothetical protein
LPRAGDLAWILAGAERPPLPDPGLRRPPAGAGRGQRHRLASPRVVTADAEVQIHPAALPLDLIDLPLAVVLAASLESQQLRVSWERLEGCSISRTVMRAA